MERLRSGAEALGVHLDPAQLARFERYHELLLAGNQRTNLTRITDYDAVQVRHFLDSLSCVLALDDRERRRRVVDVGSGAGFPGIPLKIVFPAWRLTLVDSVGKRTAFLHDLVNGLELEGVRIVTARAEDAAHQPALRGRFDLALARALAPLPVLLELCLPFLRVGGRLIALRKGDLGAEIEAARPALAALGGGVPRLVPVDLEGLQDGRALVVVEQARLSEHRYPRRAGTPERQPLGSIAD